MKRMVKASNDVINLDEYEYVTNVDGYQVYRKIVTDENGQTRGIWVAQDQDRQYPPFSITYRQARGYDPITEYEANARKLGREIGQMLFGTESIEASSKPIRQFKYVRAGQPFMISILNEYDPDSFQFIVTELHPYDLAEYAWAKKVSPVEVAIIRDGKIESYIPLPEWDWDCYEDENEYYDELIGLTCVALKAANKSVEPMIDRT